MVESILGPPETPILVAIRMLGEQVSSLTSQVEKCNERLEKVQTLVIQMEAQELKEKYRDLERRLFLLEEAEHKRSGIAGAVGWVGKNAPWIGAVLAALGFYFGLLHR